MQKDNYMEDDLISIPSSLFSSDHSSFYGDDDLRAEYNELVAAYSPLEYWDVRQWSLEVYQAQQRQSLVPDTRKRKRIVDEEDLKVVKQPKVDSKVFPETQSTTEDFKPYNYYEGIDCAKQLTETVPDFLTRLSPSTTSIESIRSAWIYVCNPRTKWRPLGERLADFRDAGPALLEKFSQQRCELEDANPGKAAGAITRLMGPYRTQLEQDISRLAGKCNITTGKWMLFPSTSQVDNYWAAVVRGTVENRLGHAAKVATQDSSSDVPERVICVYTDDFRDKDDVLRVLKELNRLHLIPEKGIYYKCDAYTYLEINSGNEYKLKASMYSSKDLLKEGFQAPKTSSKRAGRDLRKYF